MEIELNFAILIIFRIATNYNEAIISLFTINLKYFLAMKFFSFFVLWSDSRAGMRKNITAKYLYYRKLGELSYNKKTPTTSIDNESRWHLSSYTGIVGIVSVVDSQLPSESRYKY